MTANASTSSRSATITIGGQTHSLTQNGTAAATTISPTSNTVDATAQSYVITVTSNTSWTAGSNQTWATVSPASGSNNGTVTVSVAANASTSSRSATITIGGQTHSLTQNGTAAPTKIIGLSGNLTFGNVAVNATAPATLTISNTGTSTLTVSSISYPDGFSGSWSSGTIVAGGFQNVTVTFAPTAAQSYSGTVTVSSDQTSGTSTITASGTGTAAPTKIIGVSGNLAFGNVAVNATTTATLTISNTGTSTLTVSSISYPAGFSGNWTSGTIAAGGSQPVTVTFAPTAAQSYNGTVTVSSDMTNGTNTISCSGAGLPANGAPTFTTQPTSQTVTPGGNASFTATVSGTPTPVLKWQMSTNGGSTWTNLSDTAPYSGSATGTLTITGATTAMNSNEYQCLASNSVQSNVASNVVTLTVTTPGSLWSVGWNYYGQLGDGTTTQQITPELIISSGVQTIAAGYGHSLFLKADGSLWAMGWNYYGQLGDGTTTRRVFESMTPTAG
jgi:hypothetical protein